MLTSTPHPRTRHEREPSWTPPASRSGQALDRSVAREFGAAFGHDFSRVRVHADDRAAAEARAIDAAAFTVADRISFAPGRYAPHTASGRHLIAHELAHVVQHAGSTSTGPTVARHPGVEAAADAAADRALAGMPVGTLAPAAPAVRRQDPPTADAKGADAEKKKDEDPLLGGLKVVGEQIAADKKLRAAIIDPVLKPLKLKATRLWDQTPTWAKGTGIGLGAAGVAGVGAWQLSTPTGRERLSGANLALPLTLVPYVPITDFHFDIPDSAKSDSTSTAPAPRPGTASPLKEQWRFSLDLNLADYLKLLPKTKYLRDLSVSAHGEWAWDPATDRVRLRGLSGVVSASGISLSGGLYPSLMPAPSPMILRGADGPLIQKQSIPAGPKAPSFGGGDARVFLSVDFLKLIPAITGR